MLFVGVDLASQPEKSSLCMIEWTDHPRLIELDRPAGDDLIVDRAEAADATGLDCPFGWPAPFVETIRRHHDGEPTGDIDATPRDLRLRTTDQWIRRHIPRDPLSVSTDRLGIVALRGIGILERLAEAGADRSGRAGFYETYPGGALAVWGLQAMGYKKRDATGARRAIVDRLRAHVDLDHVAGRLIENDDDLDALIAALVAGLAHAGHTTSPPPEYAAVAAIEGWIHVPTISLDQVAAVHFADR
jgi:uncharacterized protein DUF429